MRQQPPHARAHSSSANFLPNASGTIVNGGAFIGTYVAAPDDSYRYLEPLYRLVAQNAILNQGGRADEVRCYPGTREDVIAKVEAWRDGGYLLDRLIFWLSGPAGEGKSAIVQTVAERCIKDLIPMINFFFYRADGTRSHARSLVPTLLFQLFKNFPSLKAHIGAIIREDPRIFDASLASQFRTLLIDPILHLERASPSERPVILLIDGLDECGPKAAQSAILRILHDVVTLPHPPFIPLVASRAESQILMTFRAIGTFSDSIFLDDRYRPAEDIRRYLLGELAEIKRTHILGDKLGPEWPSKGDINAIVRKSSSQFMYAATVVRFLSEPHKSPHASLETILGIRPTGKRTPFADIDALYTHILSQVDDWDFVRKLIFLDGKGLFSTNHHIRALTLHTFDYNIEDIDSSLIVLAPIIRFNIEDRSWKYLHFYYASFGDFLHDKTRAGDFFLDNQAVATQLIEKLMSSICTRGISPMGNVFALCARLLGPLREPSTQLTLALQQITLVKWPSNLNHPLRHIKHCRRILENICRIYRNHDIKMGAEVLRSWVAWFHEAGIPRSDISALLSELKLWPAFLRELHGDIFTAHEAPVHLHTNDQNLGVISAPALLRPHSPSGSVDLPPTRAAGANTPIAHWPSPPPASAPAPLSTTMSKGKRRF